MLDIVDGGFASTGRAAGPAGRRIVSSSEGHPQRAMQLADAVRRLTQPGDTADAATWQEALAAADALVGNGHLVRRDERLAVVDPLLADWIRRRFPV